jgi:hypothetical protein
MDFGEPAALASFLLEYSKEVELLLGKEDYLEIIAFSESSKAIVSNKAGKSFQTIEYLSATIFRLESGKIEIVISSNLCEMSSLLSKGKMVILSGKEDPSLYF